MDSTYALAYVGLGYCYLALCGWHVPKPSRKYLPEAKSCLNKALTLDKELADAYYLSGKIFYLHEYNWDNAEEKYKKGIELDPDNALIGEYANLLTAFRRFDEAIEINRQNFRHY